MATTRDAEIRAQEKWRLRPDWAGSRAAFEKLIDHEFTAPDIVAKMQGAALHRIVAVAAADTPYYRDLFADRGLSPQDIGGLDDLPGLPILEKSTLQEQFKSLHADKLPDGEKFGGYSESSGSTGARTRVGHSTRSRQMFPILKQRECRWFRFDPMGINAHIRTPDSMPVKRGDAPPGPGQTLERDRWPLIGDLFETGPFIGFSRTTNSVEACLAWLRERQPDYLTATASLMDWIALAANDGKGVPNLKAAVPIGEQLTPGMRDRTAARLGATVEENYGLNEIGIVAARCPEGGRYHVHVEHVIVEIVDGADKPVAPGETGRMVVTNLNNVAMPMIRYVTGDLARATDGPCPCGRLLPSFDGPILREKRIAPLPPGSHELSVAMLRVMEDLPETLLRTLTSYQLHESLDKTYRLNLCPNHPPLPELVAAIEQGWVALAPATAGPLTIVTMDRLPALQNGKVFAFTSEFIDPNDGRNED